MKVLKKLNKPSKAAKAAAAKPSEATRAAAKKAGSKLELFRVSGPEGHRYEYMYLGPSGSPVNWVDEAPVEESQPVDSSAPVEEPSSSSRLEPKEPDHPPPGFAGDADDDDDDKVEVSATMSWNSFLASDADYWSGRGLPSESGRAGPRCNMPLSLPRSAANRRARHVCSDCGSEWKT